MIKNDDTRLTFQRVLMNSSLLAIFLAFFLAGCENSLVEAAKTIQAEAVSPRFVLKDATSTAISSNKTLTFQDTAVSNSHDIPLTINNSGNSDLTIDISRITITMDSDTEPGSFSIKSPPPVNITISESAVFILSFSPTALGTKSATISIPTNDIKNPKFTFTIMGTCVTGSKDITAFGFVSPAVPGIVTGNLINVNVPTGTNTALLVANFATTGFSVTVNGISQTSGVTTVDFSHGAVDYIVKAADATTKTYTVTVTVAATIPVLTTAAITSVTWTTASSGGGSVSSDGGATVLERGICWSTSANPTTAENKMASYTFGTGNYTVPSQLTSLLPDTSYYVRGYAINSAGTGYGLPESFTTNAASAPITTVISDINATTAVSGVTTVPDSGVIISESGICWSTSINPTIADSHTAGASGANINLTSLTYATIYYVRAYATNQGGTVYGNELSLKTVGYSAPDGHGIIFYDKGSTSDGWRYLEAAPIDQNGGITWWGTWVNGTSQGVCDGFVTSSAVGTGKANTTAIVTAQGAGSYAASSCTSYAGGGNSDWFLPSRDELHLMYTNLKTPGISTFVTSPGYWSSTKSNALYAYGNAHAEYFQSTSIQSIYPTYNTFCVRAARRY